jgi:hypothetical protein
MGAVTGGAEATAPCAGDGGEALVVGAGALGIFQNLIGWKKIRR